MAGNKRAQRDLRKQQKAGKYTAGAEGIMATYGSKRLRQTRGDRETPPAKAIRVQEKWQKKAGELSSSQPGAVHYDPFPDPGPAPVSAGGDLFNDRRQEGRRERPR